MGCFMGIDLGTSGLKTVVMDESGTVLGMASRAYQFRSPFQGYAEQNPEEWWQSCVETIKQILAEGCVKHFATEPDPKRHEIYMEYYQLHKDTLFGLHRHTK